MPSNPKSPWHKRGSVDNGERYAVYYRDGSGRARAYGFTDDAQQASGWVTEIQRNPMLTGPHVVDRKEAA